MFCIALEWILSSMNNGGAYHGGVRGTVSETNIQAFVVNLTQISERLRPHYIVERIMASDSGSAKRLAKLSDEELTRRFNVSRYSEARLKAIRTEIRLMSAG